MDISSFQTMEQSFFAINFDRTGTTGIGKYVLNHSFMIPGLIATFTSIGIGMLLISIMF